MRDGEQQKGRHGTSSQKKVPMEGVENNEEEESTGKEVMTKTGDESGHTEDCSRDEVKEKDVKAAAEVFDEGRDEKGIDDKGKQEVTEKACTKENETVPKEGNKDILEKLQWV